MSSLFTIDEAESNYEALRIELERAEKDLEIAINNISAVRQAHDQAWYTYVRHATPDNYQKFESALDSLHCAHEHYSQVHVNYKLVKCKFKKASKVLHRLQKRAEKLNAKQRGE